MGSAITGCGDACGCAATTEVEPEIACTLGSAEDVRDRVDDWQRVLALVTVRTPVDGGLRLELAAGAPLADVVRLVQAEQSCCSFFSFSITVDRRGAALEVRAPESAHGILLSLFGPAEAAAATT